MSGKSFESGKSVETRKKRWNGAAQSIEDVSKTRFQFLVFQEPAMRKELCSNQLRQESPPIDQVQLDSACRDSLVKVLRSLQKVYSKPEATERIKQ
ncbi:MAG: hypothetical protein ACKPJJ_13920, partial [Planctomycetaceae bacterium]